MTLLNRLLHQTRLDKIGWFWLKRKIRQQFPQVRQISIATLADWLEQTNNSEQATRPTKPILLDVRTAEEYAVSHLPEARRVDLKTQALRSLQLPIDAPIVAYCSVGYRSSRLVDRLQSAGYTNVANLEGSIFEWANAAKPVYRSVQAGGSDHDDCIEQQVQQVHPYNTFWGYLLHSKLHAYEPH
jgi:rhodanese-related sulfurtransferase